MPLLPYDRPEAGLYLAARRARLSGAGLPRGLQRLHPDDPHPQRYSLHAAGLHRQQGDLHDDHLRPASHGDADG